MYTPSSNSYNYEEPLQNENANANLWIRRGASLQSSLDDTSKGSAMTSHSVKRELHFDEAALGVGDVKPPPSKKSRSVEEEAATTADIHVSQQREELLGNGEGVASTSQENPLNFAMDGIDVIGEESKDSKQKKHGDLITMNGRLLIPFPIQNRSHNMPMNSGVNGEMAEEGDNEASLQFANQGLEEGAADELNGEWAEDGGSSDSSNGMDDDEDSNEEDNWRNEYPDEDSLEEDEHEFGYNDTYNYDYNYTANEDSFDEDEEEELYAEMKRFKF